MAEEVKETQQKKELSPKTKKILNIVLDVVIAIVLVFALVLAICTIRSKAKGYNGYTEIFSTAYIAVASESMDPAGASEKGFVVPEGKPSGFAKGDLIKIKTLSESEAKQLHVGDIITFETSQIVENKRVLNTHRIVEIVGEEGNASAYITRGDNNNGNDSLPILTADVVGIYQGKASGIGHVFLFMSSSAGFFVCVVLPTLLIVVYCAVNLILVIRKEKKTQSATAEKVAMAAKEAERERIRAELLAEMQAEAKNSAQTEQAGQPEPKADNAAPKAEHPETKEEPKS